MNSTVKIFAAFVIGSAMGVAAGLMVAPTTGRQARKKLGKKSKKLAKKLGAMLKKEQRNQRTRAKRKGAPAEKSKVLMRNV